MEGAFVAVTRKTRTGEGVRPRAIFNHVVGLVWFGVLVGVAFTSEAAPSSNGGYTALVVAGAKPSPAASAAHCRQHPDDSKFCSYGGAATRDATRRVGDIPDVRDPRVRVIVLMAPNTAPFTNEALAQVAVPVRVYGAERDDLTLVRYHAERLAKALPSQTEYVLVQRAGHFSFVASFRGILKLVAGEAAQDPEGFDRDAMHEVMNLEIVGFFDRKLPSGQTR